MSIFVLSAWATAAFALEYPHSPDNPSGAPPFPAVNCADCHSSHGSGYGFLPRGEGQELMCKSCHAPGQMAADKANVGTFRHGTKDGADHGVDCGACHDVHSPMSSTDAHNGDQQADNLKLIRSDPQKYVGAALGQSVFQARPAHFSFDTTPYNGVCQTCHTATGYAKQDGTDPHHQGSAPPNNDCVTCHPHTDSFKPSGGSCLSCHASPKGTGGYRRQVVESGGTGGDFSAAGGGPTTDTVRDEFATVSYGNNDGTATWAANWVDSEDTDPAAGNVQVTGGELRLKGTGGTPPSWVQLAYDDFEGGWGNYSSGGADAVLYTGGTYAHQADNAAQIQDNSGTSSAFTLTTGIDVHNPGYTQIRVQFWFRAEGMESGEDFWLRYYNGTAWQTVLTRVAGTDFNNGQFYSETVVIDEETHTFPTNMRIRFQCDASQNNDQVYIDEIRVEGYDPGTGGTPPSVAREADLSGGYSSATFTFDYRTDSGVDAADAVIVEASDNGGGGYTTLETITGITGASSGSKSYDILTYAASNTRVRFRISDGYGEASEFFYVDNVQIEYVTPPAGALPTFHVSDGTGSQIVTDADCIVCHDQSGPHQSLPDPTVKLNDPDGGAAISYNGTGASLETFCLNCHDSNSSTAFGSQPLSDGKTPSDIASGWTASSHNAALTSQACLSCHGGADSTRSGIPYDQNAHGSDNRSILSSRVADAAVTNAEEGLCYNCHDSDGPATTNILNLFTLASHHPIDNAADADWPDNGRNPECVACHNPHDATNADPLKSVSGVNASGALVNPITQSYQLCFRCHGDYTPGGGEPAGGPALAGRDKRSQLNTGNLTFHPVLGAQSNPNCDSTTMVAPWNQDDGHDTMSCADCHTGGPHGSNNPSMLVAALSAVDDVETDVFYTPLCVVCHKYSVYVDGAAGSAFGDHDHNNHRKADGAAGYGGCLSCHYGGESPMAGVHGSNAAAGFVTGSRVTIDVGNRQCTATSDGTCGGHGGRSY